MNQGPVPFGRYRLVSLLGEGGMAKVYRAVLSGPMGFEKEVALKRIDPRLTSDERIVKALINEARLGGQLRHRNIVEIYEFNQVDGNYYMAMEFVDGWTLDGVLRRLRSRGESIPPSVVVELMTHVCRGLEYAHTIKDKSGAPMNLVHRDLKPGNIILSRQGDVKLMDFGIAKSDGNLYKTTAADVTKGTPIYMSPEQVTGAKLDARSDIFSLGSVLHELLTNEVPFQGDNLLAIMHGVLNADITAARERVVAKAPELEEVLTRCMARVPDERFATVQELERSLRELRKRIVGPALGDWVEEILPMMPQPVRSGEFGPDGAPQAVAYGTQSLAQVESVQGSEPWQWAPEAQSQRAATIDADTLSVESLADRTGGQGGRAGAPMGRMTQDFFRTDATGGAAGGANGLPADANRTRLHRTGELVAPGPGTTGDRKPIKKAAKGRNSTVLAAGIGGGLALVVAVLWFIWGSAEPPTSTTPTPPSATSATPTPPITPPAAEPTPALVAATPAPTTEQAPTPASIPPISPKPPGLAGTAAAADPGAKSQKTPEPNPTKPPPKADPKLTAKTDARTLNPGPGTAAAASGDPAAGSTAKLLANSKPWSFVYLDGRSLGPTPVKNLEIPAGAHELRFHCTQECDPAQEKTYSFEVAGGATHKQIHYFESGTP